MGSIISISNSSGVDKGRRASTTVSHRGSVKGSIKITSDSKLVIEIVKRQRS